MSNFKIVEDLPTIDLQTDLQNLLNNKKIFWPKYTTQICLNHIHENSDDIHFGIGSLFKDWDNKNISNNKITVPNKKHILKETDFKYLCNQFKNTQFEEIYNILQSKYKIGRVRLMLSNPQTCMSWHKDDTYRIHYPIKTQTGCFMVINNQVKHLEQNKWWLTNTTEYHTAVNSSLEQRVHLVACVLIDENSNNRA